MKRAIFNYRKSSGETSERDVMLLVEPGNKYAGIDMSSVDADIASEFQQEAVQLHADYLSKLAELQARYDLKHNFRQFLKDGVSELETIV